MDKNLSCPRIKLSSSQTLILDGVETEILLLDFAQQMSRKNADISDFYFILLDAAGISPTLILNENTTAKEREEAGSFFKIKTSEAAKAVHTGCCCLWVCAQFSENWQFVSIKGETIFAFEKFLYKIYSCHA